MITLLPLAVLLIITVKIEHYIIIQHNDNTMDHKHFDFFSKPKVFLYIES